MKNFLIAIFVTISLVQLHAQDFTRTNNQFYVDLISKAATFNSDWGLLAGLRAGYNFNDNFSLGLVGHGLIPEQLGGSYINRGNRDEAHLGYAGAEFIYKYNFSEKFFAASMIMVGAGRVDYEKLNGYDYFFITEPGISFNYKLINWFGLGYSLNYRFASGVKYADFSNASLSGWSTSLDFKFSFNL